MQWSSKLNPPIPIHFSSLILKMLMFTLGISCLTTSNIPWFMDLLSQIPMQYYSSQHWTLLSAPDTSTTGHHFCFDPTASFSLELLVVVLHPSSVVYSTPSDPGFLFFWCHIFLPFYTVHGILITSILGRFASFSSIPTKVLLNSLYFCLLRYSITSFLTIATQRKFYFFKTLNCV